jgi:hypothetical protein
VAVGVPNIVPKMRGFTASRLEGNTGPLNGPREERFSFPRPDLENELGLVPITTPAYSPESNGLAEAFVGTFKRDYLGDADLRDAESVLAQLAGWIDDYNAQAPHSALGMRSPREYRALILAKAFKPTAASAGTPYFPQDARSTRGPLSGYSPKIDVDAVNASS